MKLEYLYDISNGGEFKDVVSEKLVRLFDFDQSEAIAFRDILSKRLLLESSTLALLENENSETEHYRLFLYLIFHVR